ncbi:hypothetical protein C9374_004046 [Naegleria lovaniensis]|uniref:ELM2 domain-containing protein n=1 Tax=Naegleria lovaniensis TaxID=51637 RepID=A0AA88KSL9_NAELO|nr:uncharacterized protein C9374_004046 [Naegleria lovaniensis]KAG2394282.1 hypothetical protein C9374_004046 [Naegleria lovaniensis]
MPPSSPLLPSTKTPTTKPPKGISPAGTIPTPSFKSSNAPTPSCALPTKTTPLRNNNHCSDTSPFTPSSTNTTTSLHQTPSCSYQHSPTSSHPTSKSFPFHTPPLSNQISPHARLYLSSPRDPMIKSTPPSSSLDSSLNQQQPCQTENGDQPHSCKIGPMHQATLPTLCPKPKQFPITYSQRIGQCVWTPLELMVPSVAETCSRNVICDTLEKLEAFEKFCLKIVKNPDDYRQDKALEILHTFNLDIHQAKRFIKEHPMQITTQPLLTSEQSLKVFNALSQFHLYNGCLRELHRQVIPEVPYSTLVCHFFLNKKNKSAIPKSLTRIINHGRRLMQQQKLSTATTNSDESSEDDEDDETYHDGSQLSQPSQNSTLHTISAHSTRANEALNRHHAIHSKSNNNNEDEPSSGDERVPESSDNEESNSSGEEENHNDAIKYQPLLHPTHCHTNHFLHNNNHHFGTTTVTNHQDVNYLLSSDSEEADMFSNEGETYIGQKAAEIHSGGSSSSAEEAMYIAIENEDSSSTTEVFNFEHNQMFEFHPPTFE